MYIEKQFNELTLMKMFEIPVIDKRTNKPDFIVFDICVNNGNFVAQHIATTTAEEQSNKIAHLILEIDEEFSLDQNLEELYAECINKISSSEFFELSAE